MPSDTIKLNDKKNVRIIAHRGLSGIERQNTNSAFIAAANRSYFGIETDIHVTKDEKFAVIHDDSTGGVCSKSIPVEKSTFSMLSSLILKNTDSTIRSDLRIPQLCEYISICKKYGKAAVLEIKNLFEEKHLKKVVKIIKSLDYLDGVIFISFCRSNVVILRKLLPKAQIQYLFSKLEEGIFDFLKEHHLDADVFHDVATPEFVNKVHSFGQKVNVWTVDNPDIAKHLIDVGVDYITSNILE